MQEHFRDEILKMCQEVVELRMNVRRLEELLEIKEAQIAGVCVCVCVCVERETERERERERRLTQVLQKYTTESEI